MKKKNAFTLLEIMIVIFLIGLIGSVVGYNMKGSMDEGRAFKTKQAISRVEEILDLELARGESEDDVAAEPGKFLKASGLLKDSDDMLKDGWGNDLLVEVKDGKIVVTSEKYNNYKRSKSGIRGSSSKKKSVHSG